MTWSVLFCTLALVGELDEAALLARFCDRAAGADVELVGVLRPAIAKEVKRNWRGLRKHWEDLESFGILAILELREDRQPVRPPIAELVKRVIGTAAKRFKRDKVAHAVRDQGIAVEPSQEQQAMAQELLGFAKGLPAHYRETILLQAKHILEGHAPLHEALKVDPKTAQRRLLEAQAAAAELFAAQEVAHA